MQQKKKYQQGTVKRHPDGFGFFIPDDHELPDVYIPRNSMNMVMTNDRVMVEVFPERGGARFRGEIKSIVSRGTQKVVGTFAKLNETWGIVRDDGKGWGRDLKIKITNSMSAKAGELVAVEIITFPEEGKEFEGRVVEVIGSHEDPLNDVKRVLHHQNIPHEWEASTLKEAERFHEDVEEKDMRGRKDIRHLNLITIDGATAKDFDDAIYVASENHGYRLYVAIADVSHYVKPGTSIDEQAYERGTSVYFPNFVVPMLPEVLSNGLCSLNPHKPRLALVAEMLFDFTGQMTSSDFYEAVIESKARVIYGEAQEIIDGQKIERLKHVEEDILRANDLAKILMAKRFQEGSLDLEIPEMQMVLDSLGNPIDLIRSERLFAHRLIEEMMLAANVAVAKFFGQKEIPAVYRIHDSPNAEMMAILEKYLQTFGGQISLEGGKLQKKLTKALQQFEGKAESQVLNILTLRSMSQAKYSVGNVGHFGLGFADYTHFTSPIRRYPDLIVHRLLKSLVVKNSQYKLIPEEDLATAAAMLSSCEQRAAKAERQFQAIKKARFMEDKVGEEFEGVISSVTKFGVFVLLRNFEVDGLVRVESLGKERFEFDEDTLTLVAPRSGLRFAIGDAMTIRVAGADTQEGKIDFELASSPPLSRSFSKAKDESGKKPPRRKQKSFKSEKPASRGKFSDKKQSRPGKNKRTAQRETRKSDEFEKSAAPRFEKPARPQFEKKRPEPSRNRFEDSRRQQEDKQAGPKIRGSREEVLRALDAAASNRPEKSERSETGEKSSFKKTGKRFFDQFRKNDSNKKKSEENKDKGKRKRR